MNNRIFVTVRKKQIIPYEMIYTAWHIALSRILYSVRIVKKITGGWQIWGEAPRG